MASSKTAWLSRIALLLELLALGALLHAARLSGFGRPAFETLCYQPAPDTPEQVYAAWRMAHAQNWLIPVAHELHPSRYSPLHPAMLAVWIRLHHGRLKSATAYAPFAILTGLGLLWFFLYRLRCPPGMRLLAIGLLLYSKLFFEAGNHILQEGSLWLLFTLALVTWYWALHRRPHHAASLRWRHLPALLAGICCGMLVGIRPTLAPLPALLVLQACILAPPQRAMRLLAIFGAGAGLPLVGALVIGWIQFGYPALTGYHYWIPQWDGGQVFAWRNPWRLPVNITGALNNLQMHSRALLARSSDITTLDMSVGLLLLNGALLGALATLRTALRRRTLVPFARDWTVLLLLLSASQFALHICYEFYAPRFYIIGWPALVLAGLGGWTRIILFFASLLGRRHRHLRSLLNLLTICATLATMPCAWVTLVESQRWTVNEQYYGRKGLRAQAAAARKLKHFEGPLLVAQYATLNARLFIGWAGSSNPVLPIFAPERPDWDPHLIPYITALLPPPRERLRAWAWRAGQSGVWQAEKRQLVTEQIDALKAGHQFAIFYPLMREGEVEPFLKALLATGWQLSDFTKVKEGRFFVASWEKPVSGASSSQAAPLSSSPQ
jgi:hypothetical protein